MSKRPCIRPPLRHQGDLRFARRLPRAELAAALRRTAAHIIPRGRRQLVWDTWRIRKPPPELVTLLRDTLRELEIDERSIMPLVRSWGAWGVTYDCASEARGNPLTRHPFSLMTAPVTRQQVAVYGRQVDGVKHRDLVLALMVLGSRWRGVRAVRLGNWSVLTVMPDIILAEEIPSFPVLEEWRLDGLKFGAGVSVGEAGWLTGRLF